jgi:hypothetical protein
MIHLMTVEIPTIEPTRFRAGDTVSWSKSLSDYPASDSWVLHYRFINSTSKIDITAAADGSDHLVSVSAADSAAYRAGDYTWTSWVTKDAERYTIAGGRVTILPDLAAVTSSGFDLRSTARKTLDLVDAAMLAHGASAWTQEYEIAGRRMRFKTVGEFMSFRSRLKAEVRAEENAERIRNGERPRNRINVRF